MKSLYISLAAAGALASGAAAEVSFSSDLKTAYVFHGTTWNDGAVVQSCLDAYGFGLPEAYGYVGAGVWANYDLNDDYGTWINSSAFSELDVYVYYGLPTMIEGLDVMVAYTEYSYPVAGGEADREFSVSAGYGINGFSAGTTYFLKTDGLLTGDAYLEFTAGYDYSVSSNFVVSVGGRIGYSSFDGGDSGLSDYDLTAMVSYPLSDVWSASAGITYIGVIDDDLIPDADLSDPDNEVYGYDVDVVGTVSLSAAF